ncbi:hypothetical protein F4779DRAFT_639505 [Xylariaceae sp. FL0662B]|nr:hypothetical protein F4779DRAFT_639505 [Xylariaceae sp. FL0662B]
MRGPSRKRYHTGGNDPNGDYSLIFDSERNRLEEGLQTTNIETGTPQMGFLGFVAWNHEHYFLVVNRERQAAFTVATLDHNGTVRPIWKVLRALAFHRRIDMFRIEVTPAEVRKTDRRCLEQHSNAGVKFATECRRTDNGFQGDVTCAAQMGGTGDSPNGLSKPTTAVRDRRILVADTEEGVVLAVPLVDSLAIGQGRLPESRRITTTDMVPQ